MKPEPYDPKQLLSALWQKHVRAARASLDQELGMLIAKQAASGVEVNSGSPLLLQWDVQRKHLESAIRATLEEFENRAAPGEKTGAFLREKAAAALAEWSSEAAQHVRQRHARPMAPAQQQESKDNLKWLELHLESVAETEVRVLASSARFAAGVATPPASALAPPDTAPERSPTSCFVIMPIGRKETDRVWERAYKPTIESCGLDPIRIDERDTGGLLTQQIVYLIQTSHLVVADLSFARPNCYYELGFAHGVNRWLRVILCCRDDHLPDSPKYDGRNKVHFDLQNHGIAFWNPKNLKPFKRELRERITYRLDLIKREEQAEREADRRRTAKEQETAEQINSDVRANLDERLKLATHREQERRATIWKSRS